jgi:hypothetical protein
MKTSTVIECWRCGRLVPTDQYQKHYDTEACREGSVYRAAVKDEPLPWKTPWIWVQLAIIAGGIWWGAHQPRVPVEQGDYEPDPPSVEFDYQE